MKKQCMIVLFFALLFVASGCIIEREDGKPVSPTSIDFNGISEEASSVLAAELPESSEEKILIAYFTWAENAVNGTELDTSSSASVLAPGNVGQMAAWIWKEVGGDLFSIQVEEPYSADYDECLDRAADEKAGRARPALKEQVENLAEYDTIFIGFPNWWYTAPMAVFSFLENNPLADKKIVLFCSHGTGGLASCVKDISAALPDSTIESNVLGVYRDDISEVQETIKDWLEEIGY